jgi:hypothetical protein
MAEQSLPHSLVAALFGLRSDKDDRPLKIGKLTLAWVVRQVIKASGTCPFQRGTFSSEGLLVKQVARQECGAYLHPKSKDTKDKDAADQDAKFMKEFVNKIDWDKVSGGQPCTRCFCQHSLALYSFQPAAQVDAFQTATQRRTRPESQWCMQLVPSALLTAQYTVPRPLPKELQPILPGHLADANYAVGLV